MSSPVIPAWRKAVEISKVEILHPKKSPKSVAVKEGLLAKVSSVSSTVGHDHEQQVYT